MRIPARCGPMAGKGKPGRASSGRKLTTLRLWHYEAYAAEARRRGVDFTRYVNEVMAEHHGFTIPDDPGQAVDQLALTEEGAA